MGRASLDATQAELWCSGDMRDAQTCRQRAAEYEAEAALVCPGENRRRYLNLAECWRELAEASERAARRELAAA